MKHPHAVAYIDGFNLYNGLRDKYQHRYLWLDLERLCTSLLRYDQRLVAVRYFTAMTRRRPSSRHQQQNYWNALQAGSSCLKIERGRFQAKIARCRSCRTSWQTYEEKETDVAIASALVEDAANHAFDVALLISADSDLCPALRAVRRLHPEAKIVLAFPPARRSDRLAKIADTSFVIAERRLRRCQLPPEVKAGHRVYSRPPSWK